LKRRSSCWPSLGPNEGNSQMSQMFKGAWALLKGLYLLLNRAELRALLWRMMFLLLLLAGFLMVGMFELSTLIAERFIPTGDAWYVTFLAWVLSLFAMLLSLAVGVVSFFTLGSIAVAPWLDQLYVRVGQMHGQELEQKVLPWWESIGNSLWNSVMPVATFIPLAALSGLFLLVPVYGTIPATAVWSYGGLRLLSYEFMDTPATFSDMKWRARKAEFEENRWFYFGLAGLAMVLMVVPILNLLLLPAAVVALYTKIHTDGAPSVDLE